MGTSNPEPSVKSWLAMAVEILEASRLQGFWTPPTPIPALSDDLASPLSWCHAVALTEERRDDRHHHPSAHREAARQYGERAVRHIGLQWRPRHSESVDRHRQDGSRRRQIR